MPRKTRKTTPLIGSRTNELFDVVEGAKYTGLREFFYNGECHWTVVAEDGQTYTIPSVFLAINDAHWA